MKNSNNLMNHNNKKTILIVGPTAVGKTTLSIKLAEKLNTEIISCDSRQFYKELKIGTSPPSSNDLLKIKHHFIHNRSITQEYNAGLFEIDVIQVIEQLYQTYDTIIVVGGSGLYVDAICKGFDTLPKVSKKTREQLTMEYQKKGIDWLQKKVKNADPNLYANCDKKNPQRLLRALEIFQETGKKLSSFKSNTIKKRPFEIIKIGLNINRKMLYDQINQRVDMMIEDGLIEEVRSLLKFQNINALKTVGYQEVFEYLNGQCTLQDAVRNIKKNTRRFAKRQLTWFKKDREIKWFEPHDLTKIERLISKL